MDSGDKRNVNIVGIACATVIFLVLGCFKLYNAQIKVFVENGFTQQTLQGQAGTHWVKTNTNCNTCGFHILPAEK